MLFDMETSSTFIIMKFFFVSLPRSLCQIFNNGRGTGGFRDDFAGRVIVELFTYEKV